MKAKITLFLTVLLIFICCIGAASAADDINCNTLTTDNDVVNVEQATDDVDLEADSSEDTILEVNNDEDVLEANDPTVNNWDELASNATASGSAKTIYLASGKTFTPTSQIVFGNSATIIGTPTSYISGTYSGIPFYNSNTGLSITFKNVNFKDISCTMLMQMLTTGNAKTTLEGCTFTNVNALSTGHNSVIYNNQGTMDITDCTFSDCSAAFGVVTNHNAASTSNVIMNVRGTTFENNYGYTEPGAINNCGQLYVWTSTFNNNHAVWWAGAIHTHTNAKSVIRTSNFNGNTAGWNGGALYTYSELEVYDSNFTNNNCSYPQGGGAIGASNYFWASNAYRVYVYNCEFTDNNNLATNGNGGAIAAMNGGNLTVTGSIFTHNSADNGQAICGFNTNEYANISEGEAKLVITDNEFYDHTVKTGTTVKLTGTYTFKGNFFFNSPQIAYNNDNYYDTIISQNTQPTIQVQSFKNQEILGSSFEDKMEDSELIVDPSDNNALANAILNVENNGVIIIKRGNISSVGTSVKSKNITIIGEDRENTLFVDYIMYHPRTGVELKRTSYSNENSYSDNSNGTITWVNITFIGSGITLSDTNYKFVNCTFINDPLEFGKMRETSLKDSADSIDVYNYAFENCDFVNYTQTVIVGHKFSNVVVSKCNFDNVTADSIISTNGNRTDDNGRKAGVTIKDSTFKEASIKGIVKTTDASNVIADNKYDFATLKTATIEDNVYVDAPATATSLTVKVSDIKEGENFTIDVALSNNLNANVSVVINNNEYNVSVVNGTGSLNVSDKLAANTYDVEAKYAGEYPYAASTNTTTFKVEKVIINTALSATKVSATYNVAKNLVITLTDINGNALVGKYVSVKVGTISKNIKTDKNGKVSVNVATLVPKNSYTATISFAGDNDYNVSSTTAKVVVAKATPKLTTKKLTTKVKVKTKKVTATLKDNKGKVLKNTKVTLKIKGKTYTAKTNKKGVATFKVTKLNKKGTFKGTVKFAGNKYFKAISKKVTVVVKK